MLVEPACGAALCAAYRYADLGVDDAIAGTYSNTVEPRHMAFLLKLFIAIFVQEVVF